MSEPKSSRKQARFRRVAECLYRNESSKTYYALVKRHGKQIRKSLGTQDRKLAERRLKEMSGKAEKLAATAGERRVTLREFGERWKNATCGSLKKSSRDRVELSLSNLARHLGNIRLGDWTVAHCEAWEAKRGREVAPSTFNKEREVLRGVGECAVERGILLENPARFLARRKLQKKEIVIPSREQFRKLLETMESLDPRAEDARQLVQLLAFSGMRLGEATAILWREVDFDRGTFTVTGGEFGTKNHEPRVVPLFPSLRAFLEALQVEEEPQGEDRIAKIANAKRCMASACQKSCLPHFTHHSMRHYFVSNAIEAGIDFKTIAAWVGHKDGGILVAQTYGHLRDPHSFEMAQRMTFSA